MSSCSFSALSCTSSISRAFFFFNAAALASRAALSASSFNRYEAAEEAMDLLHYIQHRWLSCQYDALFFVCFEDAFETLSIGVTYLSYVSASSM
ncbi:hypothetical protein EXN66_Car008197 [Channa argus]|uniref:Uncharacterized protein n=1 Tax=Channa argus TaxID=215402 RepID=A0A6G1PQ98_CHAAH|nr:hypothetical protein EXN66_Car008197 [Channa argus]